MMGHGDTPRLDGESVYFMENWYMSKLFLLSPKDWGYNLQHIFVLVMSVMSTIPNTWDMYQPLENSDLKWMIILGVPPDLGNPMTH